MLSLQAAALRYHVEKLTSPKSTKLHLLHASMWLACQDCSLNGCWWEYDEQNLSWINSFGIIDSDQYDLPAVRCNIIESFPLEMAMSSQPNFPTNGFEASTSDVSRHRLLPTQHCGCWWTVHQSISNHNAGLLLSWRLVYTTYQGCLNIMVNEKESNRELRLSHTYICWSCMVNWWIIMIFYDVLIFLFRWNERENSGESICLLIWQITSFELKCFSVCSFGTIPYIACDETSVSNVSWNFTKSNGIELLFSWRRSGLHLQHGITEPQWVNTA